MARMSVPAVARIMGKDPQVIREYIKSGLYPFAVANKRPGSTRWDYTIFPAKFKEYYLSGESPDFSVLDMHPEVDDEEDDDDWD